MITAPTRHKYTRDKYTRHKPAVTRAVTHSTPSLTLHQGMSPEHAPVPPRPREVLEPGPAHGHAQPSARAAGRHGGVVRLEGRPAVGREGSDVVRALHVSARVRPARVRRTRQRVCGASGDACVARRGGAGTQAGLARRGGLWHTASQTVPEPDVGLDVLDGKPGGGLAHPADKQQVLPVRALEPDVFEGESCACVALPA